MEQLDHKTMCTLCRVLPLSTPHTPLHINMEPVTDFESCGSHGVRRLYRCSACFTHWLYQKDKWESCQGFKLWDGNLESYQGNSLTSSPARSQTAPARIIKGQIR